MFLGILVNKQFFAFVSIRINSSQKEKFKRNFKKKKKKIMNNIDFDELLLTNTLPEIGQPIRLLALEVNVRRAQCFVPHTLTLSTIAGNFPSACRRALADAQP